MKEESSADKVKRVKTMASDKSVFFFTQDDLDALQYVLDALDNKSAELQSSYDSIDREFKQAREQGRKQGLEEAALFIEQQQNPMGHTQNRRMFVVDAARDIRRLKERK